VKKTATKKTATKKTKKTKTTFNIVWGSDETTAKGTLKDALKAAESQIVGFVEEELTNMDVPHYVTINDKHYAFYLSADFEKIENPEEAEYPEEAES